MLCFRIGLVICVLAGLNPLKGHAQIIELAVGEGTWLYTPTPTAADYPYTSIGWAAWDSSEAPNMGFAQVPDWYSGYVGINSYFTGLQKISVKFCWLRISHLGGPRLSWVMEKVWYIKCKGAPSSPTELLLSYSSIGVEAGETFNLQAFGSGLASYNDTWKSSDSSVAEVKKNSNLNATVTAKKEGHCVVSVNVGNLTATCDVYVRREAIDIDENNFPDDNFRKYLLSIDVGSDGKLESHEIDITKLIDVSDMRIKSLKGIEFFRNLRVLDCDVNQISTLDLSHNLCLTLLSCSDNPIKALDLSHNDSLEILDCGKIQATSLDLSHNKNLKELMFYDTQFTSLDLSHNAALEQLACWDCQLANLDLSHNVVLKSLQCSNNIITELDLSHNAVLEKLNCQGNKITKLNLSNATALKELYCYENQITSLDLSDNIALEKINCSRNQLTKLRFCPEGELSDVSCSNNYIYGVEMDNLINSLPYNKTNEKRELSVYGYGKENNVLTKKQAQAAKAKGWTPKNTSGKEYEGIGLFVDPEGNQLFDGDEFEEPTNDEVHLLYKVTNAEDGICELIGYKGLISGVISIPEKARGLAVESIGKKAFREELDCKITEIEIPNTIKHIKQMAFFGCRGIYNITFPTSLESIDSEAFGFCGIKSISIPKNVTYISGDAFCGNNMESIVVDADNAVYESPQNCNAIIEKNTNTLIVGCSTTIIPKNVLAIGNKAFYGTDIVKIELPSSIHSIGENAFNCYSLVAVYSYIEQPFVISDDVFYNYESTYLYVPIGTKSKYESSTGWNLFKNIIETDGNTLVDGEEFEEISSEGILFTYRILSSSAGTCELMSYKGEIKGEIIIPEKAKGYLITTIGNGVFNQNQLNYDITGIKMPNTITEVKDMAFHGCIGVSAITLPSSLETIGEDAFGFCGLTTVTIPKKVSNLAGGAFLGNKLLSISVEPGNSKYESPSGSNAIIEKATKTLVVGCSTTIIPNNVVAIGNDAFYCSNIEQITIPDNVTSIGDYAFGITSMRSIELPSSIRSIGKSAFGSCSHLFAVFTHFEQPFAIPDDVFDDWSYSVYDNAVLYVPVGTKTKYETTEGWNKFKHIVEGYPEFKINIAQISHGTVTSTVQQARPGDLFTLKIQSDYGYKMKSLIVEDENGQNADRMYRANEPVGTRTYYMPNSDVNINAIFIEKLDSIRIVESEHGTITASTETTKAGDTVTLAIQPENGFMLENLNVVDADGNSVECQVNGMTATFVMPASDVTVTATFVEATMAVTTSAAGYATFFDSQWAYSLPSGLQAQTVTGLSGVKLTYQTLTDGVVPKGTAVMLSSGRQQSENFTLTRTESTATFTGANLLHGSDEATTTTGDSDCYFYKLTYGSSADSSLKDVFGWYWGASNGSPFQIEGHKAWLTIPKSAGARSFNVGGEVNGLFGIDSDDSDSDHAIYDLQGRRVSDSQARKGLYIRNGKKVIK